MFKLGKALLESQKGQGLVEYSLILALISIAAIAVMPTLGTNIVGVFNAVIAALP